MRNSGRAILAPESLPVRPYLRASQPVATIDSSALPQNQITEVGSWREHESRMRCNYGLYSFSMKPDLASSEKKELSRTCWVLAFFPAGFTKKLSSVCIPAA